MLREMTGVLIVSHDWRSRALLRAELIDQGFPVRAYESLRDARAAFVAPGFKPGLLVADLARGAGLPEAPGEALDETSPADELCQLAEMARQLPVWVLAGHSDVGESELEGRGFEAVIFRPVALGELAESIKRRLEV